jgi:segregation and condensation protein B
MLFVGNQDNQPLSAARAAELMRDVSAAEIPGLVDQLNHRYAASGCPYKVVHQGNGYQMVLGRTLDGLRSRFYGRIRQARLSQAAIDVLAIVAYQQPLTADQIGKRRGKPSSHVLAQLVHRGLLRIQRSQGDAGGKRRTTSYFTTDRFLELFNLESLQDLPQSEEP